MHAAWFTHITVPNLIKVIDPIFGEQYDKIAHQEITNRLLRLLFWIKVSLNTLKAFNLQNIR